MEGNRSQKNLLVPIAAKYAIIVTIFGLLMIIFQTITFNPNLKALSIFEGILSWTVFVVCIGLAYIEYNRKNENFIAFKDAILIGLIIIAIYFAVTTLLSFLNLELFLKEKIKDYYLREVPNSNFSTTLSSETIYQNYIFSGLLNLFLQVCFLFWLITLEAQWKIFKKAGLQGWESLIPIYNTIIFIKICGKPGWWFWLLFIPLVNIIFAVMIYHGLSKAFGKTEGFTAGLIFLPFVFFPILGLSRLKYQ
jgi:hypothetical protein